MPGSIKLFSVGVVTGASMWAGGFAVSRVVFKNACMTQPIGSCWRSPLSWMFDFLGDAGVTPAYGVTTIICIAYLCVLVRAVSNHGEQPGSSFTKGMAVGLLAAMVISLLLW